MRLLLVIWILAVSLTAAAAAAAADVDVDVDASTTSSTSNGAAMINVESIITDGEAEEEEESKKKIPPNEIVRHRIGQRRKTPLMDVIETDTNINNRKEAVRPKKENFASGISIFLGIQKGGGNQHDDDDDKKKQQHLSDNRDIIGQVVVVNDNNNNNDYYYPVVGKLNYEIKKNQMDVAAANEEEASTIMMKMILEESSVSGTLSMELRLVDFSLSMDMDTDDSIKVEQLVGLIASSTSDADGAVEPALVSHYVFIYLLLKDFVCVYVFLKIKKLIMDITSRSYYFNCMYLLYPSFSLSQTFRILLTKKRGNMAEPSSPQTRALLQLHQHHHQDQLVMQTDLLRRLKHHNPRHPL
jgi:hypothetical protein